MEPAMEPETLEARISECPGGARAGPEPEPGPLGVPRGGGVRGAPSSRPAPGPGVAAPRTVPSDPGEKGHPGGGRPSPATLGPPPRERGARTPWVANSLPVPCEGRIPPVCPLSALLPSHLLLPAPGREAPAPEVWAHSEKPSRLGLSPSQIPK